MKLEPLDELRRRAVDGDIDAQIRMGNRYLCGVTVQVDLDEAAKWFLLAGKSGSAAGFMSLGLHYSGSAKPRDVHKAIHFYEKAAKLGHVDAQLNLGRFYFVGDGVEQDYVKARKWIKKAAAHGSHQGLFLMGALYDGGLGLKPNTKKAIECYELSVAGGYACAMHNLGCIYLYGQGVEPDVARSTELFRRGAELNHPPSLCNLGAAYSFGRGVEKDIKEAVRLFRESAIRGYAVAQMNMAGSLAFGSGCRKNIPLSYAWANIAEQVSEKARRFLAEELAGITPKQRAEGEGLVLKLKKEMAAVEPSEFPFINDGR
jgi:TPR repeat protein